MNRRRLIADSTQEARRCDTCGCWPAPVQWDKATRLCELCASVRRHPAKGALDAKAW